MNPQCLQCLDIESVVFLLTVIVSTVSGSGLTFLKMRKDWQMGRSLRPPAPRRKRSRRHDPKDDDEHTQP